MGKLTGKLEPRGPFIEIKVIATPQRVAVLKKAAKSYPAPLTIRALLDTGASGSAIDSTVISALGLTPTGSVLIHTPSTGSSYETRDEFDLMIVLGENTPDPKTFTVGIISSSFASEGFLALIGWDVLSHCVLTCNGPARSFSLDY